MQSKIIYFILALNIVFMSCVKNSNQTITPKPNIIFIMSDDHAYQAIGAYGSVLNQTPNIDRLAEQGMRYDRAFVSNSICAPSRAVAITGKFSHLNSVKDNRDVFDGSQQTLPKILQEHGYQTAVVGKWHLKTEPTGFDYWKVLPDQGDYYQPKFRTPQGIVTEQGYVTDLITDFAIGFLDSLRDKSKPFLLMYHHKAPHREWWPSMENLEAYKDKPIPEPPTLFDDYTGRGAAAHEAEMRIAEHMGLSSDNKIHPDIVNKHDYHEFMTWYEPVHLKQYASLTPDEKQKWDTVYGPINADFDAKHLTGDSLTHWKYQRYMQDYLGVINSVDSNVGRLMDYLEKNGLAENTLIIYTSDQGFYLGEHGWFDKRFMYEESFRTPLIMRWPEKIKPGQANTDLVQNIDFAPTILAAAGIEAPADMQGKSMVPLFKGKNEGWREALYYHYYEFPSIHMVKRHYGVRTDRYKLIHFYYDIDEWELYDLEKDPQELKNVYNEPEYAAIKKNLHKKLEELRIQYKDSDELTQKMLEDDLARMKKK
ncbi:MAG: sulfatase [Deferribacteres bacterium]|nr:sulfatase [Deferribacteres bacterium]